MKKSKKSEKGRPHKGKGQLSYEEVRARLEEIVGVLEQGNKPLEENLELYEEGVRLLKTAHGILSAAEKRLEVLKGHPDGTFSLERLPEGEVFGPQVAETTGAYEPDGPEEEKDEE